MATATVTSKGQITIPKEVRDALGLETGHRVSFLLREDGVVEMHPDNVDLLSLCGVLKPAIKGVTLAGMAKAIREGAAGEEGGGDFADYVIREHARAGGCEAVATFDGTS